MIRSVAVFLVVACVTVPSPASAQVPDGWRFRQLLVDNDLFAIPFGRDHDRFYSSGIRVSLGKGVHGPDVAADRLPVWLRPVRRRCPGCVIYPNLSVGHEIYTPDEIDVSAPQPGDHPWSAWLYTGMGGAVDTSAKTRHNFEFQVGVTGDPAGGNFGQVFWHEVTGSPDPRGWDNQLGPDLGINAYYHFQHILREARDGRAMDWDFVPEVLGAVGTMRTYVGAGGTVRVGRNITDFPNSPIQANNRVPSVAMLPNLEIYGFMGLSVRAVAYNYFLEGSLFGHERYTVDPHRYVWDFRVGVTARFRRYNISYVVVRRSKEFVRTSGNDRGIHTYGTLSFTFGTR